MLQARLLQNAGAFCDVLSYLQEGYSRWLVWEIQTGPRPTEGSPVPIGIRQKSAVVLQVEKYGKYIE